MQQYMKLNSVNELKTFFSLSLSKKKYNIDLKYCFFDETDIWWQKIASNCQQTDVS